MAFGDRFAREEIILPGHARLRVCKHTLAGTSRAARQVRILARLSGIERSSGQAMSGVSFFLPNAQSVDSRSPVDQCASLSAT
jgi:hypothetical protein